MVSYYKAAYFEGNIYTVIDKKFIKWAKELINKFGLENLSSKTRIAQSIIQDIEISRFSALSDIIVDELLVISRMEKTMLSFKWHSEDEIKKKKITILC